jgi:hypothetical protein
VLQQLLSVLSSNLPPRVLEQESKVTLNMVWSVKTSTFFIAEASLSSNSCVIASKTPSIFLKISSLLKLIILNPFSTFASTFATS